MAASISKAPIQSTAGAVPVKNDKGEMYMQKVKVQRYIAGKRPEFAHSSDSDSDYDAEHMIDMGGRDSELLSTDRGDGKASAVAFPARSRLTLSRRRGIDMEGGVGEGDEERGTAGEVRLTEEEKADPRMRRMMVSKAAEVEDDAGSSSEEEDRVLRHKRLRDPEMLATTRGDSDSDGGGRGGDDDEAEEEMDEEEMEKKRELIRQRALLLRQRQEEDDLLRNEELVGSAAEEDDEDDDLDYSEEEYTDSEDEMAPRLKPVFVRKRDRVTFESKHKLQQQEQEAVQETKKQVVERRRQTLQILDEDGKREVEEAQTVEEACAAVHSDDGGPEEEYEAWKVRELKRIRRDRELRLQAERDKEELSRLHKMTEEERNAEFERNPKAVTNKAPKGKYKFLQKYYHRGAFYVQEKEEDVYKRDYAQPTLEDHFDKTVLPKVMQVKNFGRAGRTKYTHLVDQDTTQTDSPWAGPDLPQNLKLHMGGMKQSMEKPSVKRKK